MQVSFRTLSILTATLCFVLALVWGLLPQWLLQVWGVDYSSATGLVSRRSAMLFLGLGVMFYSARNAAPSVARTALSTGFITGCFGLAGIGLLEWLSGHAGPGILLAVSVELGLGLGFIQASRNRFEAHKPLSD